LYHIIFHVPWYDPHNKQIYYHNDNATLVGLPDGLFNRFQSVLNDSAQLVADLCRSAHTTDTLACFH